MRILFGTLLLVAYSLTSLADANSPAPKLGDVNDDGIIDKVDVSCVIRHILGWTPGTFNMTSADVNEDGKIDITDVSGIISIMLNVVDECRFFKDEATGDEAIISATGNVMIQNSSDEGGYMLQLCSYDAEGEMWSTEKCVLAELDDEEQLRSLIFSDFSLLFTPTDARNKNIAIIRHNSGEYELLGQIEVPANSRSLAIGGSQSLIDRAAAVYDIWGLVEEPVKAKLTSGELNKMKWAGDLWSSIFGIAAETYMERVGNDYSTTIGNAVGLLVQAGFNLAMKEGLYSNPVTAALFLLKSSEEGRQHVFNKLIGKDFAISDIKFNRKFWDNYEAVYAITGLRSDTNCSAELDFIYYPRKNNVGWAVFPKTSTDICFNKGYVKDMSDLVPGPNELLQVVYIKDYRWLGWFKRIRKEFFVGLNNLAHFETDEYEETDASIIQQVKAYSVNRPGSYPLVDYGTYIRHGDNISRFKHTENLVQASIDIPSDVPSISEGENACNQQIEITIEKDELNLLETGERVPKGPYYIGAYSYNFKTGEYEYYDEHDLELKYIIKGCPDEHHPHMIELGLPSGTKWACCNIGASAPYEYGGKYAWGETNVKSDYFYSNYSFAVASANGSLTVDGVNYNFIYIGEDICGTNYDAAHVNWGDRWRMPSVSEMEELVSQCTWELGYDNPAYTFCYKVTGPNGASILLPGYFLQYWTGTLNHVASNWWDLYSPIPYVLWSDPSPHVHSPTGSSDKLGYFTGAHQGCYVRAVYDATEIAARKTIRETKTIMSADSGDDKGVSTVVEVNEATKSHGQESVKYTKIVRK